MSILAGFAAVRFFELHSPDIETEVTLKTRPAITKVEISDFIEISPSKMYSCSEKWD
jgi:hypothetical protein